MEFFKNLWKQVLESFKKGFVRFPEVLITGFADGAVIIYINSLNQNLVGMDPLVRAFNVLFLLIPILLFNALLFERFSGWKNFRWPAVAGWTALAVAYYFILPLDPIFGYVRYNDMFNASILLLLVTPYYFDRKKFSFFAVDVVTKFLISALYSSILFTGLTLITLTINILFGIDLGLQIYVTVLTLVIALVFLPSFLGQFPKQEREYSPSDFHPIWKTLFATVLVPLASVLGVILLVYLAINLTSTDPTTTGLYVFATLILGYVGLVTSAVLEPIEKKPAYVEWFHRYFPYLSLALMVGFYFKVIQLALATVWTIGVLSQLFFGLWIVVNAIFAIVRFWNHLQVLALTAIDILLFSSIIPFVNRFDLSTTLLNSQFVALLEKYDMLDEETQTIIPKPEGFTSEDDETKLYDLVLVMAENGYENFPYLPEDFSMGNFYTVFGFLPQGDTNPEIVYFNYSLTQPILDLSTFESTAFYLSSMPVDVTVVGDWSFYYSTSTDLLTVENSTIAFAQELNVHDAALTLIETLGQQSQTSNVSEMSYTDGAVTLYFLSISGEYNVTADIIDSVYASLFVGITLP